MTSRVRDWAIAAAGALMMLAGAAHAGSTAAGNIESARELHGAVVLHDGDVLLIGGVAERFRGDEIERYDLATRRWTSARRSPGSFVGVGAVVLASGKVVVSGNFDEALYQYDPDADTWETLGNSSRTHAYAQMYERFPSEVIIVGGLRSGGFIDGEVDGFDTIMRTRNAVSSRSFRGGPSVQLDDLRVFSTGGSFSNVLGQDVPALYSEVYSQFTQTWRSFGDARFPNYLFKLADGRVLALGGVPDPLATSIFDPVTETWTARRPMLASRNQAAITQLNDGRIMVSGGYGQFFIAEADVQIYDPATDRWSWSVPMPQGRKGHSATVLPDGPVLIAGGDAFLTSTVLYTPEPFDDDNDLVANNRDNCPAIPNPDQADLDGDHLGDICDADDDGDQAPDATDNCARIANADQADLDGDDLGDACDDDDDGDQAPDTTDNCARIANADQANLDGDDLGDACDNDIDGDGINNTADNCSTSPNANQANLDGDAQGDACDADLDGDGVANATDNCATTANPDQADADGDHLGNACDATPNPPIIPSDPPPPDDGGCSTSSPTPTRGLLPLAAIALLAFRRRRR